MCLLHSRPAIAEVNSRRENGTKRKPGGGVTMNLRASSRPIHAW